MSAIRRGKGAPTKTTKGSIGDTYIDLENKIAYKCVTIYHESLGGDEYDWVRDDSAVVGESEVKMLQVEPKQEPEPEEQSVDERPKNNYHKPYKPYNKQFKK